MKEQLEKAEEKRRTIAAKKVKTVKRNLTDNKKKEDNIKNRN